MEEQKFKVIIVEDVKLELKGTEEIFRHEIPNAEVIGTAMTENEFWPLMEAQLPDLVLLDLGLGGSTTIGVDICRNIFKRYKGVRVLIFTGEILNEKLWVDVLNAVPDQAQVSNDPCIFVLIHFGIMLPIQLPPVKNLLGHADQIADFGNDHICTVWIVDFFLNGFFCLLLGRIRLLCAGFVDLFEFFNGHCHL